MTANAQALSGASDHDHHDPYIEDYFLSGSQEVVFENDMNTDLPCVAFAFAVYSWGEPTGSYAVSRSFYPGEPR